MGSSLFGVWIFVSLIYHGQTMPMPNPNLKIQYEFSETGINTLHYFREGESGFCERRAVYQFSGTQLLQEVVWTHPENAMGCDTDSDMRLGTKSRSRAWIQDSKFHLEVLMGEESLIYVWEKQTSTPQGARY